MKIPDAPVLKLSRINKRNTKRSKTPFALLGGSTAEAAIATWTGATNALCDTAGSWSPSGVPVSITALIGYRQRRRFTRIVRGSEKALAGFQRFSRNSSGVPWNRQGRGRKEFRLSSPCGEGGEAVWGGSPAPPKNL